MTKKSVVVCCLTVLLLATAAASASAQDDEADTLEGINAVSVVIEDLNDAAKTMGLTADAIRSDVELKLQVAGLHVVTASDVPGLAGAPHLYVNLTSAVEATYVHVEFRQNAILERNNRTAYAVTTWQTGSLQVRPTLQSLRDAIKGRVDEFLHDWRSVNPENQVRYSPA
jgi:hypothetical protein